MFVISFNSDVTSAAVYDQYAGPQRSLREIKSAGNRSLPTPFRWAGTNAFGQAQQENFADVTDGFDNKSPHQCRSSRRHSETIGSACIRPGIDDDDDDPLALGGRAITSITTCLQAHLG